MGNAIGNLYDLLVELSGLERNTIDQELGKYIRELGLDPKNLSTNDIRRIATLYLFDVQNLDGSDLSQKAEHNYKLMENLGEAEA
jgi:hypothetical protein